MKKNLRKNKKGFTLVEIIVVLLIIGILLAILIPSIMGYVGKAKDAQIEAEARSGYVAAQTILARESAKDSTYDQAKFTDDLTEANIAEELGEGSAATPTIKDVKCAIDANKKITKCNVVTTSAPNKQVTFADGDTEVNKPKKDGEADAITTTTDTEDNTDKS